LGGFGLSRQIGVATLVRRQIRVLLKHKGSKINGMNAVDVIFEEP
jgi:hypothetical protein